VSLITPLIGDARIRHLLPTLLHPPRSVDPVQAEPPAASGGPGPPPARGHLDQRPHGARRRPRAVRGPGRRALPGPVAAAGPGVRGRPRPARRHVPAGRRPRGHPGPPAGHGAAALPAAQHRPTGVRAGPDGTGPARDAHPGRARPRLQPGWRPGGAAGPGRPGDMAQGLRPGDSVQVLAAYTEGARRGRAVVLLPSAEVVQVFQDPAGLTGAGRIAASSSACRATVPRSWPPPSPPRGSSWSRPAVPPATMAPPRRRRRVAPAPRSPGPTPRSRTPRRRAPQGRTPRAGRLGAGRLGAGRLGAGRLAARYLDAGSRCPRPRRVPSRRRPADPDLLLRRRRHPADRYPTSDQVDAVTRVVMT